MKTKEMKKNSRSSRRKWKKSSLCLVAVQRLLIKNDGKEEKGLGNDIKEENWSEIRTEEEMLCSLFVFKFLRRELKVWLLKLK